MEVIGSVETLALVLGMFMFMLFILFLAFPRPRGEHIRTTRAWVRACPILYYPVLFLPYIYPTICIRVG
jgi:hypothetical protein